MIKCRMNARGAELIFGMIVAGTMCIASICGFVALATGHTGVRDTVEKIILEIVTLIMMVLMPCLAMCDLNRWLFLSNSEIRLKSLSPFEHTYYWCPMGDIVSVKVWSDRIPSDPRARIQKIVVKRPTYYVNRYNSHFLTITDDLPEIRQIMDIFNSSIPDRVVWEVQ